MNIQKYFGGYGAPFDTLGFMSTASMSVKILPELIGKPVNHVAMGFISAFRPTILRISRGELTTDFINDRVTVLIDDDGTGMVIKDVFIEKTVLLPEGIPTAGQLRRAL